MNIIKATTNTVGTGVLDVSVQSNFVGNGWTDYSIYSQGQWERGRGVYSSGKLYREHVVKSSASHIPTRISLSGPSDVIFSEPVYGTPFYTELPESGNSLFYDGYFWSVRNLSSGDVVSALGYIPGTGGSGGGESLSLPIQISDVSGLGTALDSKQVSGNYALAADLSSKANLIHSHAISDVINLQSVLDNKQASGNYAASSHTHLSTDIIGLDGQNAYGYNVYNYGVSHTGNALTNTLNFQYLMDKVGVDCNRNQVGGLIDIPAQPSTGADGRINLEWPVYINHDNLNIRGDSMNSSRLRGDGPAIVFGRHPKHWSVARKTFDDKFECSGSLTNGSKVVSSISTNFVGRMRSGCAVSGVGLPSPSMVTGINYSNGTIYLKDNASSTISSNLFFYSSTVQCSGQTSTSSPIISGIPLDMWSGIYVGSLVSGIQIKSESFVVEKTLSNSGIMLSKYPSSGGYREFSTLNLVNNSVISIKGNVVSGSKVVTGISDYDIKRISIGNYCYASTIGYNNYIRDINYSDGSITMELAASSSVNGLEITITGSKILQGADTNFESGFFDLGRFQDDLADYVAGGLFKPLNGNASYGVSIPRNQYKTLRTRGGIAQYRFPFHPMQTGRTMWPDQRKLTWEFVVYHHENFLWGGIAGVGGIDHPDPWFLSGGPVDQNNSKYVFDVALTDESLLERSAVKLEFAQPGTKGIHRIAIQFDADNAVDPFIAWVDGVRVQVKFGGSNFPLLHSFNWYPSITTDGAGAWDFKFNSTPFKNLKFSRIARWEWRELNVGGVYESPGKGQSYYTSGYYESDFTILGVSCYRKLLYKNGTVGSSQLKDSNNSAADDSYVFAYGSGYTDSNEPLGSLTFLSGQADQNDSRVNAFTISYGKSRLICFGHLTPRGTGNHGDASALAKCSISNLNITQSQNNEFSCGIYQGNFLYGNFENLKITGYGAAIGSSSSSVCYTAHYKNLDIGGLLHIINQAAYLDKIDFNYPTFSAMRTAGSRVRLNDFMCASPNAWTDGFWTDYAGSCLGAGIEMTNGMVNWEDFYYYPSCFFLYTQKRAYHPENYVKIKNVTNGTQAVPILYFDDMTPSDVRRSKIDIDGCLTGMSEGIFVRGSDWEGSVDISPEIYSNTVVKFLPPHDGSTIGLPKVKTLDKFSYTLPYGGGGYVSNCHEITTPSAPDGGVKKWICENSTPTGVFYEGSSSPPSWKPVEVVNSFSTSCVSANGLNSVFLETSINWPEKTGVPVRQGGFQIPFAKNALSHIFLGASAANRSHFQAGYTYNIINAYGYTDIITSHSFLKTPSPLKVADYFPLASNGIKENVSGITFTTTLANPWKIMMARPFIFSLEVGINGYPPAYFGRTPSLPPEYWDFTIGQNIVVPSGGMKLKHLNRSGGWTIYGANKIMDYILDSSPNAQSSPSAIDLSSNLYIGLSTTEVSASGTNISEPVAGGYSRKLVARNSSNWELFGENYAVRNKNDIIFDPPTNNWGYLRSMFISDATSGGNIIFKANLNKPINIASGMDPVTFKAGSIHIQI